MGGVHSPCKTEAAGSLMRVIVQPLAGPFEVCPRLGLVLAPAREIAFETASGQFLPMRLCEREGKAIHAVLENSPSARAGLTPRDVILALNDSPWEAVRFLTFSDRRPSEIALKTFVGSCCKFATVAVRVPPEPYLPFEEILAEATAIVAAQPMPVELRYSDPDLDEWREVFAMLRRRRRRR
jgi:hypothetical protein